MIVIKKDRQFIFLTGQNIELEYLCASDRFREAIESFAVLNNILKCKLIFCTSRGDHARLSRFYALIERINCRKNNQIFTENNFKRVIVAANQYKVGDTVSGKIIHKLGRRWRINALDYAKYHVKKGTTRVQYAYLK